MEYDMTILPPWLPFFVCPPAMQQVSQQLQAAERLPAYK